MSEETKQVPTSWKVIMDGETIAKSLTRISYEIVEKSEHLGNLAIVGIRTGGEFLASRIRAKIQEIEGREIPFGVIDITLYRDDLSQAASPVIKGTDLPFRVSGARIVLVDDILFTGRTIRSALDAITDFGRPACVELAVLADRGHRELPIRADYVGKNIPTQKEEFVKLRLKEMNYQDNLYLIEAGDKVRK